MCDAENFDFEKTYINIMKSIINDQDFLQCMEDANAFIQSSHNAHEALSKVRILYIT